MTTHPVAINHIVWSKAYKGRSVHTVPTRSKNHPCPRHPLSFLQQRRRSSIDQSKNLLIAFCANSTPKKVAAFAGTALAMAGPRPGKKALKPPRP